MSPYAAYNIVFYKCKDCPQFACKIGRERLGGEIPSDCPLIITDEESECIEESYKEMFNEINKNYEDEV